MRQDCGCDPWTGPIQGATNKCMSRWNSRSMFLFQTDQGGDGVQYCTGLWAALCLSLNRTSSAQPHSQAEHRLPTSTPRHVTAMTITKNVPLHLASQPRPHLSPFHISTFQVCGCLCSRIKMTDLCKAAVWIREGP